MRGATASSVPGARIALRSTPEASQTPAPVTPARRRSAGTFQIVGVHAIRVGRIELDVDGVGVSVGHGGNSTAPGPGKTAGEDAAVEVAAKLPLHISRYRPQVIVTVAALGEPGLEVLLDAAVEHALARMAQPIPRSCAVPGPALDPHPCPRCPALRRWGSGWAARCAGRHWPQGLRRAAEVVRRLRE